MPYHPFQGLQAPQGLQMQWQPNVGGQDDNQFGTGMASASDALQNWLALRRKKGGVGSAMAGELLKPMGQITDVPMQRPQNIA